VTLIGLGFLSRRNAQTQRREKKGIGPKNAGSDARPTVSFAGISKLLNPGKSRIPIDETL
jgi:hypothetical protein